MDNETQIIRAVQQGQTQAFAQLVGSYQGRIFNLAYRMTGRVPDAEDLTQEAFLKAFQSIRSFDTQKRFFPWLFTIALNVVRNHLKKEAPRAMAGSEHPVEDEADRTGAGLDETLIKQQARKRLEAAVALLPMDQREAVIMRYYLDMSFDQLAEALNISVGAAKMRVKRGLEALRLLVGDVESWT